MLSITTDTPPPGDSTTVASIDKSLMPSSRVHSGTNTAHAPGTTVT